MGLDVTGLGAVSDLVTTAINKIWPDKTEQEKAEIAAATQSVLGQLDINKEEAKSSSVFVAGWRPYIGWVCGTTLLYVGLIDPLGRFIAQVAYHYSGPFPAIDTTITLQVLLGMLGLGGMRTAEKFKGVASK